MKNKSNQPTSDDLIPDCKEDMEMKVKYGSRAQK